MSAPARIYDTCGICHGYSNEDRERAKQIARGFIRDRLALAGLAYDGACFLVEDGEAAITTDLCYVPFDDGRSWVATTATYFRLEGGL